jgi:hypothetical protein
MTQHTSKTLRVENNTYTVIETAYDENDKPIVGKTITFDTEQEAQEYMDMADQNTTNKNEDAQAPKTDNSGLAPDNTPYEKPASEMTEADAVALNADVHLATPATDNDRVVTDGEKDQVAAGLHPKPESGDPLKQA